MKRSEIPDGVATETGHQTRPWIVIVHWDDDTATYGPFETQGFAEYWEQVFHQHEPDVPTSLAPLFGLTDRITVITRYDQDVPLEWMLDVAKDGAEQKARESDSTVLSVTEFVGHVGWCEDGNHRG